MLPLQNIKMRNDSISLTPDSPEYGISAGESVDLIIEGVNQELIESGSQPQEDNQMDESEMRGELFTDLLIFGEDHGNIHIEGIDTYPLLGECFSITDDVTNDINQSDLNEDFMPNKFVDPTANIPFAIVSLTDPESDNFLESQLEVQILIHTDVPSFPDTSSTEINEQDARTSANEDSQFNHEIFPQPQEGVGENETDDSNAKEKNVDESKFHKCVECNETIKDSDDMLWHLKAHSGRNQFKCLYCPKSLNNFINWQIHTKVHTGESHKCSFCGKVFNKTFSWKRHERIHTGEKPYKCSFCHLAFVDAKTLKIHEKTHTEQKGILRYKCPFCKCEFTCQDACQLHTQFHKLPYKCSFCLKAFDSMDKLIMHERVHTGEKPYKCPFCEKAFARQKSMNRHKKTHNAMK